MQDLVDIRLKNPSLIDNELKKLITNQFYGFINELIEVDWWHDSVKRVIITDDFQNEVYKQAELWNVNTKITESRDAVVVSKVLFNRDFEKSENIIFIEFNGLFTNIYALKEMFFKQVISVGIRDLIPIEFRKVNYSPQALTLDAYITSSVVEWVITYFATSQTKELCENVNLINNHNDFFTEFKRSLKRELYNYQSTRDISLFWNKYNSRLYNLFTRILENKTNDNKLLVTGESGKLIYSIINEIEGIAVELVENQDLNIYGLKDKIKQLSSFYGVHLERETDKNFYIRLSENPKNYFKDIVDTEPRIVCFLDILGFSELINQYDNSLTSTVLQDIQESFSLAEKFLLQNNNIENSDVFENLEYQTFSDNICISIPYFNNADDFLFNFHLITLYTRGLQMVMMSKGFFVRGGISIGSYYSDNNIIFSKGLVNAYKLESTKAVYPRIIIDKEIVGKILGYNSNEVEHYGFDKSIILDWEYNAFLNPIGVLKSSLKLFKSLFDEIHNDEDADNDDELSKLFMQIKKSNKDLLDQFESFSIDGEVQNIDLIKEYIEKYLSENIGNERAYSKYLWIKELFKWLENDGSEKLRFYYFSEILNKDKEDNPS
jgi:hypothetical protein